KEFATELISHSLPCEVISSPPHCGAFSLSAKPQIVESWLPLNGEAGGYHFRGIGKIKPLAFWRFVWVFVEKPGIERPCARTDHCQGGAKRRRHNVNQGISCERESDPNLKPRYQRSNHRRPQTCEEKYSCAGSDHSQDS